MIRSHTLVLLHMHVM